jgi:hypothetical protein
MARAIDLGLLGHMVLDQELPTTDFEKDARAVARPRVDALRPGWRLSD